MTAHERLRAFVYQLSGATRSSMEQVWEYVKYLAEIEEVNRKRIGELENMVEFLSLPWYRRVWYALRGQQYRMKPFTYPSVPAKLQEILMRNRAPETEPQRKSGILLGPGISAEEIANGGDAPDEPPTGQDSVLGPDR